MDREGRRFGKRYEWRDGRERCYWRQERAAHRVSRRAVLYAGHTVVDGVSLQVDRGELVALLGPNGCGKTTIMRLINGLELADAGIYLFGGHVIDAAFLRDSAAAQRFHQRVGFVFQNADAQLFCATVGEEVAFGPAQMGLPTDELERRVRDAMELFQVADLVDASPYQLSGGQRSAWRWLRSCR